MIEDTPNWVNPPSWYGTTNTTNTGAPMKMPPSPPKSQEQKASDRKYDAEHGLLAILYDIGKSDDPRKAASEWLTKVTNEVVKLLNELDKD